MKTEAYAILTASKPRTVIMDSISETAQGAWTNFRIRWGMGKDTPAQLRNAGLICRKIIIETQGRIN